MSHLSGRSNSVLLFCVSPSLPSCTEYLGIGLCLAVTEKREISLEDSVRVQRPYFDETVTFVAMFRDLGLRNYV
ncbi:unnamed protein product [Parnassius apollo]|uniref:(apollo) hypothetical protein n=1 Tax=Parnassius apollo TaxID=110799 RepID=A0A8S3WIF0_PARAO|nr:unnamed protein product [Parnassius apollo]